MTTIYAPDIALEIQRRRLKRLQGSYAILSSSRLWQEIQDTKAEIKQLEDLIKKPSSTI